MSIIGAQQQPQPWLKRLFGGGPAAASNATAQETLTPGQRTFIPGLLALATCIPLLISQAEHASKFGSDNQQRDIYHDALTFISRVVGTVSTPFTQGRMLVSDLARKEPASPENPNRSQLGETIEENHPWIKKKLGPKLGWLNNIIDPQFASSIGSLIFSIENMLSSFFIKKVEGEDTKLASAWEAFFPPFAKLSSFLGSILSIPGHASAAIFRLGNTFNSDNTKLKAANFIAQLGEVFQPLAANLNAFYKTLKSFKLARVTGMSQAQASAHYGINGTHIVQGILGSLLAIPSFFGSFSRFRKLFEEGEEQKMISNYLSGFTAKAREVLQKIGEKYNIPTLAAINLDRTSAQINEGVNKTINNSKTWIITATESICNMPLIRDLLRYVLPYDSKTERITLSHKMRTAEELSNLSHEEFEKLSQAERDQLIQAERERVNELRDDPQNKIKGFINKCSLIEELDHFTRPIQSVLMLLPSALPRISDPDIQVHGTGIVKAIDIGLGLASAFLGLPSFMIYACSTRAPKMIAMYYGQKQKYAQSKGDFNYSAMDELIKLQEKLLNNKWLPFSRFVGKALDRIILDKDLGSNVFRHETSYLELLNRLEKDAQSQERHVKTITTLDVARRFLKTLIYNPVTGKLFKTKVPMGELSPRDKGKQQIYNLLTKGENLIRGLIPGFGWLAALPFTVGKKIFYVRPPTTEETAAKPMMAPAIKNTADAAHLIPSMAS